MNAQLIIIGLLVANPSIQLSSSLNPSNILKKLPIFKNQLSQHTHHDISSLSSISSSSFPSSTALPKTNVSLRGNSIGSNIQNLYKPKFDFKSKYNILQYLWPDEKPMLKFYLLLALVFMVLGKWMNLQVPFLMQDTINILSNSAFVPTTKSSFISKLLIRFFPQLSNSMTSSAAITTTAATLSLVSYGVCRALAVIFAEIKTCLFAQVSFTGLRKFANQIFQHLHELDAEFHLKTPSGVVSVAYVRAIRGFQGLLFQIVFSVIPTILELSLVARILYIKYGKFFSFITLATFILYGFFTIWITQWRVKIRQELVEVDNQRNGYFIDSILNHEVVKYFTNEDRELRKFDKYLQRIYELNIESTIAVAILNFGQTAMFSTG